MRKAFMILAAVATVVLFTIAGAPYVLASGCSCQKCVPGILWANCVGVDWNGEIGNCYCISRGPYLPPEPTDCLMLGEFCGIIIVQ